MEATFHKTSSEKDWYPDCMYRTFMMIGVLFLLSCSTLSTNEGEVISRPFSAVDAGTSIVIAPNHNFEIVLPSNPTTGYDWILEIEHPNVISKRSHRYVADRSGRIGVGGETTWSLKSKDRGTTILAFSYQRIGEDEFPPSSVVTFTIVVR